MLMYTSRTLEFLVFNQTIQLDKLWPCLQSSQAFSFSLTILGLFSLLLLLLFLSDKVPKNYFSLLVLYLIVQVSDFSCQEKTLNVWKTNQDTSIIDVTDL